MKKALLLAVIGSPTGMARKYLNCDVTALISEDGVLKAKLDSFFQYGGHGCLSGYQELLVKDGYRHDPYWHRKAKLEKGCEWINLKECRRDLIKRAVKHLGYEYDEVEVDPQCLVRFDACCQIDPWRDEVIMNFERDESWVSGHQVFEQLIGGGWDWHDDPWVYWHPRIAALPVLPFRYYSHDGKARWARMQGWDATPAALQFISSVIDMRARAVKRTWQEVQKTVSRAIRKGKTSTAAAREWFAKNQMLSRFIGWAEKQHN